MDTQTQIDRLIELAIVQRSELKQLVSELPQLREYLGAEIERTFEEAEPQIRTELEEFCRARATDEHAKTGAALAEKVEELSKQLEVTTAAKYSVLMAERAENVNLLAKAEARIEDAASMLSHAVKEIVTDELSRFPRAGEIDQLRKEFAEPRGLNPRGRWMPDETYQRLDLVTINGDSFVSNIDGNRERPSRTAGDWTLSAARGNGGGGGGATSLTDLVPVPANGELLIGNGSAFVNNTLTAGTGLTITNGPGTITIDASGAQELLTASVVNAESVPITRGQVVYLFSATGFRPSVKLANNSADATSAKTFGVVSDDSIAANGIGTVTCVGVVDKLALGAYNDGDSVYLGATSGTITTTKPYAPNHLVYVGIIERANNGNGELYVRIQNGYELDEIHDVQITSAPLAGALLMRDATNSLWKANRLSAGTNIAVTNADTSVTIGLTGTVAVANGGTGVTSSTGSGSVVLSTSPTLTTPISATLTSPSATDLTLAGGSTGASLVLGQGATGVGSLSRRLAVTAVDAAPPSSGTTVVGGMRLVSVNNVALDLGINGSSSPFPGWIQVSDVTNQATHYPLVLQGTGSNVLIGGTTDIPGSGGLKVYGTTAASSTTSGALQVAGGVGVAGAGYFGGNLTVAKPLTSDFGQFNTFNDLGAAATNIAIGVSGSTRAGTYFGQAEANSSIIFSNGTSSNGLLIGSFNAKQVVIGTNNTAAISIHPTTQAATFAGAVTIGGTVIHTLSATPASASATGTVGTMSWDASYIYICTAANTWKRVAIATW